MSDTVIGWDISTTAIGICVLRKDREPIFHVIFPEGETHLQKWVDATQKIERYMQGIVVFGNPCHVVEERLSGFTGGQTSKQTLLALAAMNAVVSRHLVGWGEVVHMAPVTTKRIMRLKDLSLPGEDKKQTVVRLARSSCPNFPYAETKAGNWKKGVDDMADAWLLAEAGLRVLRGEASIGRPEKAGGREGKARGAKAGRPKEG